MNIAPVRLKSCLKAAASPSGKAIAAEETLARVQSILAASRQDILRETRRIDTGRLGIPVYMSICAGDARALMPTRKQMGKGPTAAQAEASAVMELMERHAFFGFWIRQENFIEAGWEAAREKFGAKLLSESEMLKSVQDAHDEREAREILNLAAWQFHPATRLSDGRQIWLPVDWFRMLGEFNGSSAGNTDTESVLQGLCELVERHVCCLADKTRAPLPTISQESMADPILRQLVEAFRNAGINLVLKDMSMGLNVPTIAALAWDPATFPASSEIVFTAGTASSPSAAAIRALTEVAQLGGDFCTSACYEASGLPKFSNLSECAWLLQGESRNLDSLPNVENADMALEIRAILEGLAPLDCYAISTADPDLQIPAHWIIAPGLEFRERDRAQSLGLFTGRKLAEQTPLRNAMAGLEKLAQYYPGAHFLPFFTGLCLLRNVSPQAAQPHFHKSIELQPHADGRALASFYTGHCLGQLDKWEEALPFLQAAFELCPQVSEYGNLAGIACYRLGRYDKAEDIFDTVLKHNRGSAIDLANRGVCRKFLGRGAEARIDLETALELDPSLDFARTHLADLPL